MARRIVVLRVARMLRSGLLASRARPDGGIATRRYRGSGNIAPPSALLAKALPRLFALIYRNASGSCFRRSDGCQCNFTGGNVVFRSQSASHNAMARGHPCNVARCICCSDT